MNKNEKIINWIEDMGTSGGTEEYRRKIENTLPGIFVNLLFDFNWVREELKCGNNGMWIVDGGFPTRLSGLVQRIKEEHPYAKIIVYHAGGEDYSVPNVDAQLDITKTTPAGLAKIVSEYLN